MAYRMYFYRNERGDCDVRSFLRALPHKHRRKCLDYLNRVRVQGTRLPSNIVKHLERGLWEVRPEYGGIEYRFLFFVSSTNRIGVVSAFVKKQQKIQRNVLERGLRLAAEMQKKYQEEANEWTE